MIAFVTLLLGLISGIYPIEVTVSGPVAIVEFQLDGAQAGRLAGPPWVARIDLGTDLRPHELIARALDAEGKEIARVSQWLNLPRPVAEVEIVLENGQGGVPKAAVLTWQIVNGVKPTSIGLNLDGLPLTVMTRDLAAQDGGMLWFLTSSLLFKEPRGKGRRVADAVAVAGLQAAAENYRRAVVLVVGKDLADVSHYDPGTVRRYLQSVRVPLFVWGLYGPDTPAARAWGGAEDISTLARLREAVDRLKAELEAQKIVWVEGRYLPQEVALTPAAQAVELPVTP